MPRPPIPAPGGRTVQGNTHATAFRTVGIIPCEFSGYQKDGLPRVGRAEAVSFYAGTQRRIAGNLTIFRALGIPLWTSATVGKDVESGNEMRSRDDGLELE